MEMTAELLMEPLFVKAMPSHVADHRVAVVSIVAQQIQHAPNPVFTSVPLPAMGPLKFNIPSTASTSNWQLVPLSWAVLPEMRSKVGALALALLRSMPGTVPLLARARMSTFSL